MMAGGRNPRRAGERLSKNRTFRVRGKLDEQLIAAAAESGRSVSEEIERRLEASFASDRRDVVLWPFSHPTTLHPPYRIKYSG